MRGRCDDLTLQGCCHVPGAEGEKGWIRGIDIMVFCSLLPIQLSGCLFSDSGTCGSALMEETSSTAWIEYGYQMRFGYEMRLPV